MICRMAREWSPGVERLGAKEMERDGEHIECYLGQSDGHMKTLGVGSRLRDTG